MSHLFQSSLDGAYVDWGDDVRLYIDGDMSMTLWLRLNASARSGDFLNRENAGFAPAVTQVLSPVDTAGHGWGVQCYHVEGGSFTEGVRCVPGLIDPKYELGLNRWMFFAFSRFEAAKEYLSYFGSRNAIVDGQVASYTNNPIPPGPGHPGINFYSGLSTFGDYIGPFTYWKRALTKSEIVNCAKCIIDVTDPDLMLFSKMDAAIEDLSSYAWVPTIIGNPQYLADDGCAQLTSGQNYRIYAT